MGTITEQEQENKWLASKLLRAMPAKPLSRDPLEKTDIVLWAQRHFYIPETSQPIVLYPHQQAVLRAALYPYGVPFPFTTIIYSAIKKSGKTAIAGVIARWIAEKWVEAGQIFCTGNDAEQAQSRAYRAFRKSIELTPGFLHGQTGLLPGKWQVAERRLLSLANGTEVKPIACDYRGEAGANPTLTTWTELWGYEHEDARRFWEEMTPVPTLPISFRLVETYAGYDGESELLSNLYWLGKDGRQLTAGELYIMTGQGCPGCERKYEGQEKAVLCRGGAGSSSGNGCENSSSNKRSVNAVNTPELENGFSQKFAAVKLAFEENSVNAGTLFPEDCPLRGKPWCGFDECLQPESPVPVWINEKASLFMYWDSGSRARRMPWQVGKKGDAYYEEEEAILHPRAFSRLHLNEWVGAESAFIPIEIWDACGEDLPELDAKTPIVIGVDAATTGDCFGAVAVSRHPTRKTEPAIRAVKKWAPPAGGRIDYAQCEAWLREVVAHYNVIQIAYDQYQLEDMMQRFRREQLVWVKQFSQMGDRLVADRQLYDLILQKRIAHNRDPELREHIINANVKLQKDEDSKMRIVKKSAGRHIDLAVAASMGVARCLYLNL